jgi:hypothetical protein
MDWTQLHWEFIVSVILTITATLGTTIALHNSMKEDLRQFRHEHNEDLKERRQEMKEFREQCNRDSKEFREEMKHFHNRVYSLEERSRKHIIDP